MIRGDQSRLAKCLPDTDAHLWHPWLRIKRVLRLMLHTRWRGDRWPVVKAEFRKALALRSKIRRAGGSTRHPRRQLTGPLFGVRQGLG